MKVGLFIPDELRKNFNRFKCENPHQDAKVELEVRFGYFENNQFNSKLIDKSLYLNVKAHLDNLYEKNNKSITRTNTHRIVEKNNLDIRKIQEIPGNIYYQKKVNDWNFDNKDWGLRFSRSYETDISEKKILNFHATNHRDINRYTYVDNRFNSEFFGFKIEISEVYTKTSFNYELELEALPNALLSIDKWWSALKTLYGWTLNAKTSNEIISIKERISISNYINFLLSKKYDKILVPSLVNRPKTLTNTEDIENKAISVKLDGLHKMLLFCQYGIYSCSPSSNIIKISDVKYQEATILECEYMPQEKIFYCFDVLIYQNIDVRCTDLKNRYNILNVLMKTHNLDFIKSKTWYFPEDKKLVSDIINENNSQLDGLIFQSVDIYEKSIYKWKPPENLTIDLYVQMGADCWEAYASQRGQLKKVKLVFLHGFFSAEQIHKKIVECRWSASEDIWNPIKIRDDKLYPNSYEVVISTMNLIKNPVTINNIIDYYKSSKILKF